MITLSRTILEIAVGKSSGGAFIGQWCVLAGYGGRWELVSEHKTESECLKGAAKAVKRLAGHDILMAALRATIEQTETQ